MKNIVVTATCGGGRIKMSEAGSTNTTSGKFYLMEDGRILGARGHIHGKFQSHRLVSNQSANALADGGVGMHMSINDKYVCSSLAEYGYRGEEDNMSAAGTKGAKDMAGMGGHAHGKSAVVNDGPHNEKSILTVAGMSQCSGGPFKVKKGDYITLKAEYDLKKHPL
jgi:hypothetical protein